MTRLDIFHLAFSVFAAISVQSQDHIALQGTVVDFKTKELLVGASVRISGTTITDGPATGKFKHGFPPTEKSKLKISRADVAMFLLMQLESDEYHRKTPALSY